MRCFPEAAVAVALVVLGCDASAPLGRRAPSDPPAPARDVADAGPDGELVDASALPDLRDAARPDAHASPDAHALPDAFVAPDAYAPPAVTPLCITSSLRDDAAIREAGFSRQGGTFRDGGWAVDATCDRLRQTLPGDFRHGSIEFEARDLLHVIPHDDGAHGCERFIFNLNRSGSAPDHARMVFANMAGDCGSPRGNLRALLSGGPCCVDGPRMSSTDDGDWHRFRVEWTGTRLRYEVDGHEVRAAGYPADVTPGIDPELMFGSECARGDETHAVFRDLTVCRAP